MDEVSETDVKDLIAACQALGPVKLPHDYGYPSLALCIIDAVQSTGFRYSSVRVVITRYHAYRSQQGANPGSDTASDVVESFGTLHGVENWAHEIGTRNRTSSHRGAPLKAEAIHAEGAMLTEQNVESVHDVRALPESRLAEVRALWTAVVGQRSDITWRYFLMLAGVPGVKPDRMITRFVATALGLRPTAVSPQFASHLVIYAANEMNVSVSALDHAMWTWQRRVARSR